MGRVLDRYVRILSQAKDDLPVVGEGTAETGEIHVAAVSELAGVFRPETAFAKAVCRDTHTGFADVIPSGPGEIADHRAQPGYFFPVPRNFRRISFRSDHDAVGISPAVRLIASGHVVITRYVKGSAGFFETFGNGAVDDDLIHFRIHDGHKIIYIAFDFTGFLHFF